MTLKKCRRTHVRGEDIAVAAMYSLALEVRRQRPIAMLVILEREIPVSRERARLATEHQNKHSKREPDEGAPRR